MRYLSSILIGFIVFISFVSAQTPAPTNADRAQLPGKYSGRAQEQGGGPRWSDLEISLGKVAEDGRFTGTVQAFRAGPACGRRLPLSGELLPDGSVRMEVKQGSDVIAGCERTYDLKLIPGGRLTGTSIFGGNRFDIELKRVGD